MSRQVNRWFETRAFGAAVSCLLLGGMCAGAVRLMGLPDSAGPLWALCGIQTVPVAVLAVLFSKLTDVRDIDGLTRTERRRLADMVAGKTQQVISLFVFLVGGSFAMALGLYAAGYNPRIVIPVYGGAGALIGLSLFFTVAAYLDVRHIAAFRTKVSDRAREAKKRAEVMAKLAPKTERDAA